MRATLASGDGGGGGTAEPSGPEFPGGGGGGGAQPSGPGEPGGGGGGDTTSSSSSQFSVNSLQDVPRVGVLGEELLEELLEEPPGEELLELAGDDPDFRGLGDLPALSVDSTMFKTA